MAYQNDDKKDNSIQTRSTGFNCEKDVETPILLLTSFQNDMLKLSFCGELPASQQTDNKRFDRQNPTITCITREKCNLLAEAYKSEMEDIVRGIKEFPEEGVSVSISVAGVNLIQLAADKNKNGVIQTHLRLIRNINPDNLTCDNITDFIFPKGEYIVDYKPTDGSFTDRKLIENGIFVFVNDLKEFSYAASKAYVHAARCVDKSYKDMVYDAIVQIAGKVGAELKQYGGGTGNSRYGSTSSMFDRNSHGTASSISNQPTMTLDELEKQLAGDGFMNVPDGPDEELPFN